MSVVLPNSRFDEAIPHPILDNSSKMMRLIANPVYDRLTLSRAANVRKYNSTNTGQQEPQLNRERETSEYPSSQPIDAEEITTTPLSHPSDSNVNRARSKSAPKIQSLLPIHLRTALLPNSKPPRSVTPGSHSRVPTARSRASTTRSRALAVRARQRARPNPADLPLEAIQAELIAETANIPKPVPDRTIRYVNTRHGFEVQYYSSRNWLSTDVYTKDTLPQHEQTFREMLEKKRLQERLSRNIYSSDYYSHRLSDLLHTYKQGNLSHAEWAKQNYQLHFLKTLYIQAVQREQKERSENADNTDIDRPTSTTPTQPSESKDTKTEENIEQQNNQSRTHFSNNLIDEASFISTNSFTLPISSATDGNPTPLPTRTRLVSISTNDDTKDFHRPTISQPLVRPKTASTVVSSAKKSKALFMFDEQRWSLQAMVKRVVGLADKRPSTSNLTETQPLSTMNIHTNNKSEKVA
ncbi:unnamed protein product [Adineta ricciae]|uniref:Uncharacterized protein n=1 Tax=Adineta ricciae TaxID=249248 RepID=A0A813XZQ9_ADIRI|nr:unnamed protein product [Adineta ricciae]CAF0878321.1 unnamed protein product [Adineta ricciae]